MYNVKESDFMPRLNLGRPIPRHIVRDLVGISAFGSSKGESPSSSHISKPRTPECRKCPESGPQYREAASTVHPQETPGARLGSSPFRPSRLRNTRNSPSYSRCARCRECPGPGPTTSPSKFRAIRSERDAWCPIRPSRRFSHRRCE
jgi:hypothetical protein